ncbi:MAG: NAD(P)-binding protein [Gammaproteobacteria bacterium]|nr:FAD-dependent monooxygenase [Gammaproteobacteria bacterium]NNL99671.1 NAD(P)-binding protein [Gammaproteobacteria bacterium]
MESSLRIHVLGAGIGGLTTAIALRRAGFAPTVFEQASALQDVGAGITLGPNATRVMQELGLAAALEKVAWTPRHAGILHFATGEPISYRERGDAYLDEFGAPFWHIHRADLLDVLGEAAAASADIHFDHRLVSVRNEGDVVISEYDNGRTVESDLLIACNGIKSTVRDTLFAASAPEFTGYVAWRGLVPLTELPDFNIDPDFGLYLGPNRMVGRYAVRHRSLLNYVAMARKPDWCEEGWMVSAEVDEVLAEFEGWHDDVRRMIAATPPAACFKWALHVREPISQWINGRVALLGDAAHPMTPFLGLGAGIAIEDALVLARAFESADDPLDALQRYQDARVEHANMAQAESSRQGLYLLNMKPGEPQDRSLFGEDPFGLYGYDARSVAV